MNHLVTKKEKRDFFSRVHRPESACTSGSIHCPLLHLEFINALSECGLNTACVCMWGNALKKRLIYPSYLVVSLLQHLLGAKRGVWTLSAWNLQKRRARKTERRNTKKRDRGSDVRPRDYLGHWWQIIQLKCKKCLLNVFRLFYVG